MSRIRKPQGVALAAIVLAVGVVVVRGKGPATLAKALKATTSGAFYHWRDYRMVGGQAVLRAEGWCALRRSRTLTLSGGKVVAEERRSPSGIYRIEGGQATLRPGTGVVGMEERNDPVSQMAAQVSPDGAAWTSLGGDRYQCGKAVYRLEPRSHRILGIETADRRLEVDYPPRLSSDLFEAPH